MKLVYKYNNGITKKHTIFINKKSILKECAEADIVSIYKTSDTKSDKYITTLLIK